MAASHLMTECKLLENAPEFAKSRPEAYLDNVKTEYAAKLAVCELLSAQPTNPAPPPHCEILVPSSKACGKGGRWWHTSPEALNDKQCYPTFKDYQYTQCLKSLQSTPQFWTSFSNARQNAVVMCQASRDAIERESHLETFKNLTQILSGVTSTMQQTTEDYEALIQNQNRFSEQVREANERIGSDMQVIQDKAMSTVAAIDNKFQAFMGESVAQLITALTDRQDTELEQIHQRMQDFSQDMLTENFELAKSLTSELKNYHILAMAGIQNSHQAQVESYGVLSAHMEHVQATVNKTDDAAGMSLIKIDSIAQRLDLFESQTEHIAEGFAFLSAIPALVKFFVRTVLRVVGILFLFGVLYKWHSKLAVYAAGICCSGFLLQTCGILDWLGNLPSHINKSHAQPSSSSLVSLSTTQKGILVGLVIWLGAYPIVCITAYMARFLDAAAEQLVRPLLLHQYCNEGGIGFLPSIEVPARVHSEKSRAYEADDDCSC
ncbi:hypothetical protein ACN47E_000096 [Coniothyrium glycines]